MFQVSLVVKYIFYDFEITNATLVSSPLGLFYLLMSYLQNIVFTNAIFAWHNAAVVDIPKHGQCNKP